MKNSILKYNFLFAIVLINTSILFSQQTKKILNGDWYHNEIGWYTKIIFNSDTMTRAWLSYKNDSLLSSKKLIITGKTSIDNTIYFVYKEYVNGPNNTYGFFGVIQQPDSAISIAFTDLAGYEFNTTDSNNTSKIARRMIKDKKLNERELPYLDFSKKKLNFDGLKSFNTIDSTLASSFIDLLIESKTNIYKRFSINCIEKYDQYIGPVHIVKALIKAGYSPDMSYEHYRSIIDPLSKTGLLHLKYEQYWNLYK